MVGFIGTVDLLNFARPCYNPADLKPGANTTRTSKMNRAAGAVVKMLTSGQTAAYISKALGVSENLIYRWKNQGVKKVTTDQNDLALENQHLKERVRQLETEREILKKALSIFSRQT
jgi:transposase